jgi:Fe-S-cluster containining protein
MKLDVLASSDPWYADGLKFTCTQCGNCCTGGPGFVWISMEEVGRLAEFLKVTSQEVLNKYCRKIGTRISLKERKMSNGDYDCIFLREIESGKPARGRELRAGERVPMKKRGCAIYPVRPLQCRTWPFWDSNLSEPKMWEFASEKCPGMGRGSRKFSREQIEALRDARDWPENPPTSARKP